jgi:hypothetical protein
MEYQGEKIRSGKPFTFNTDRDFQNKRVSLTHIRNKV